MGILLEEHPLLTDLHALIDKVTSFPISAKQLVDFAAQAGAPKAVIDFYSAFPPDERFSDKDDLIARTESVEIMHHQTAPPEDMHTPEED